MNQQKIQQKVYLLISFRVVGFGFIITSSGFIIYFLWLCCNFCDVYIQILTDVIFVSLLVNVV